MAGNMLLLAHKRWHVVMTSADHDVEPQTHTRSLKNEIKFFKRLMGVGVKSLHFSTVDEFLFFVLCYVFVF